MHRKAVHARFSRIFGFFCDSTANRPSEEG